MFAMVEGNHFTIRQSIHELSNNGVVVQKGHPTVYYFARLGPNGLPIGKGNAAATRSTAVGICIRDRP